MRHLKLLITTFLISALFSSDMITVSGSIRDAKGNLIEGVNIYTERSGMSTTQMGSFSLLCFPDEIVTISHISYSDITLNKDDKVEIVQITDPGSSSEALDGMVSHVQSLLEDLELPYRILRLCAGDMGFTASITYDFEVWSAAQGRWLEVSSVSNFETLS